MLGGIYEISDKLWEEITGIKNGSGLRCIPCLEREAEKKGIWISWIGKRGFGNI